MWALSLDLVPLRFFGIHHHCTLMDALDREIKRVKNQRICMYSMVIYHDIDGLDMMSLGFDSINFFPKLTTV